MSRIVGRFRLLGLAVLLLVAALPAAKAAEQSLAGRLLIATPALADGNFSRTIVYLIRHDAGGALGLVVNEPLGEVPLARLLEKIGLKTAAAGESPLQGEVLVQYGGPVQPRVPFVLHSPEVMLDGSVKLTSHVAFGGGPALSSLVDSTAPRQMLITLGYAGWAPGQLESEIGHGSWYLGDWDEALVFGADHAAKWNRAIALYGPEL